ncbi:MAG: cobalamin-binding protein [Clostridiales bacterium]|nr:cobalamin-binding protein [Clostridiales bacterium]
MQILEDMSLALQQGRKPKVEELVGQALDLGLSPKQILEEGLLDGMGIIGEKFKCNEVFVPEVLVAARAMNAGAALLKPYLTEEDAVNKGTVVLGTVRGDLHDIGKNLVKMMMEGRGLTVIDLGVDIPAERFIEAAIEHDACVICCSALLTTTMDQMKNVVDLANSQGVRGKFKIMVGGAPVTETFCRDIGADRYEADAASAAEAALEFCQS